MEHDHIQTAILDAMIRGDADDVTQRLAQLSIAQLGDFAGDLVVLTTRVLSEMLSRTSTGGSAT